MHQVIPVPVPYSPAITLTFGAAITAVHTIAQSIAILLNPSQEGGLINVGPMKSAEINSIISDLMTTFPATIPETTSLPLVNAMVQEEKDTNNAEAACLAIASIFANHGKIIRNNLKVITGESFDNGKNLGKNSPAIQLVVKGLSETYNSRSSPNVGTAFTVAMGGNVTVGGVNPLKIFTNDGMTILSILNVGGNVANIIKVYPQTAVSLPAGWTNILVTNLSATNEASFILFIK